VRKKEALSGGRRDQNDTNRLICIPAREVKEPNVCCCCVTASIAMSHGFVHSLRTYFPSQHSSHKQRPLSSDRDRSRQSYSTMEERVDGRVPLLLSASPPLLEEGWQFRQAPKTRCRTCLGMRRGTDQDSTCSKLACPTKSIGAVIDNQCPLGLHASVSEEARIILWPFFEGVDQVSPIETAEAVPHAHSFKGPGQFQRAPSGGGV